MFFRVFEPLKILNIKTSVDKINLKICLEVLKNNVKSPGGTFQYRHPGGCATQILTNNEPKYPYDAIFDISKMQFNPFVAMYNIYPKLYK